METSPQQSNVDVESVRSGVVEALKTVYDPEIPVNIYELGLIYEVDVKDDGMVDVKMTLTSPACPVAGSLPPEVREKTLSVEGVRDAHVEVVWDPPWTPDKMSDAARLQLGMM
jgi:FeS assembly SUF system protein